LKNIVWDSTHKSKTSSSCTYPPSLQLLHSFPCSSFDSSYPSLVCYRSAFYTDLNLLRIFQLNLATNTQVPPTELFIMQRNQGIFLSTFLNSKHILNIIMHSLAIILPRSIEKHTLVYFDSFFDENWSIFWLMLVYFLTNYFVATFVVKKLTNFFFGQNFDQIADDRHML